MPLSGVAIDLCRGREAVEYTRWSRWRAVPEQVAADLRRTHREFLRPEDLLPVTAAAALLGVSIASPQRDQRRKVAVPLFGTACQVRPEDLEAYALAPAAERPPVGEDWRTVRDLMRAAKLDRRLRAPGHWP
jgi:hypothetical protein